MREDLIERLRRASGEADNLDPRFDSIPLVRWSELFEEAAIALENVQDDAPR